MVSLNGCMKCVLISAIVFACINLLANITAFADFMIAAQGYDDNADYIQEYYDKGEASNFDSDSEWFVTISAEYEALSSFDKENVYCDVMSIQANPEAVLEDTEFEASAAAILAIVSGLGLVVMGCDFCCFKYNKFYGVSMDRIGAADPETRFGRSKMNELGLHKAVIIKSADQDEKDGVKFKKDADEFLTNYRISMAIYFITCGPFIALFWMMVVRRSAIDGLDCQELFFNCGESGNCTMDDMMLTVPLNSSLFKMLISYPLVVIGWCTAILSLCFVLGSGIYLAIGAKNMGYATLPLFMFVYGGVPLTWIYFVDPYMPFDGLYAVIVLTILPMLWLACYSLFSCVHSCKGQRPFVY